MSPFVLVTGPSGFIGAHVFTQLLHKGFSIRGTVRTQQKADYFLQKFPDAAKHGKISFIIVKDIAQPGAFEDAVKDVEYIIHVASPFHFNVSDYNKDFYEPAIHGTKGLLEEALKEKSVKRVVITSSFAAIIHPDKYHPLSGLMSRGSWPGHVYTESDWNPITWEEAQTTKTHSTGYRASKKFAEKAAWEFMDKFHPHFDIITIQPPLVFGPCQHDVTLNNLNESNAQVWRIISGGKNAIVPPTTVYRFVDVRDVAAAHVAAIDLSVEGNQRFLISSGEYTWQRVVDIAREKFPGKDITKGDPNYKLPEDRYTFDVSKAEKQLGLKWTSLEQSVTDLLSQLYKLEQ